MTMTKAEKAAVEVLRLKLALRWPDATQPVHQFGFGDYDKAFGGEPAEGDYYVAHYQVSRVELRKVANSYPSWTFNGRKSVERGRYYTTEREARLDVLWRQCEEAARNLHRFWASYEEAV